MSNHVQTFILEAVAEGGVELVMEFGKHVAIGVGAIATYHSAKELGHHAIHGVAHVARHAVLVIKLRRTWPRFTARKRRPVIHVVVISRYDCHNDNQPQAEFPVTKVGWDWRKIDHPPDV